MAIVGFNFTKITSEKKGALRGKVDIKNNVALTGVEESNLNLGTSSQKVAKVTFDFDIRYEPKIGSIKFSGEIIYLASEDKIKQYIEEYQKNKTVPKEIASALINNILQKGNVLALILSQQIGLPPPIPLPKVAPAPAAKSKPK